MKAIAAKTREEDAECVLLFDTPCEERREKLTSCSQFQDVVNHFLMQGEGGRMYYIISKPAEKKIFTSWPSQPKADLPRGGGIKKQKEHILVGMSVDLWWSKHSCTSHRSWGPPKEGRLYNSFHVLFDWCKFMNRTHVYRIQYQTDIPLNHRDLDWEEPVTCNNGGGISSLLLLPSSRLSTSEKGIIFRSVSREFMRGDGGTITYT